MQYAKPFDQSNPDAPYINGNPGASIPGSIPPAEALEFPQREIVRAISDSGQTPTNADLVQLSKAIRRPLFSLDTGSINAVVLTIPNWSHVEGRIVTARIGTGNTNTGPVTVTVAPEVAKPLTYPDGSAIIAGELPAGRNVEMLTTATSFVLVTPAIKLFTSITNEIVNYYAKGSLIARRIYGTPGTYTYSPSDSKVRAIRVIVQGAGGAGGATQVTGSGEFAAAGGGGGGGTAISDLLLATAGVNGATITVGSGGPANGNWATPGGNGGSSSFGAFLSATGGAGGAGGQSNGLANVQAGGNKGFGVGGNVLNLEGGPGQYSCSFSQFNFCSGAGGSSYFGGGAMSIYPASGNGLTPTTAGGGGSGAGFTQNSGAGVGGNGANGIVLVEEYA